MGSDYKQRSDKMELPVLRKSPWDTHEECDWRGQREAQGWAVVQAGGDSGLDRRTVENREKWYILGDLWNWKPAGLADG